jgi:hypothetical protein
MVAVKTIVLTNLVLVMLCGCTANNKSTNSHRTTIPTAESIDVLFTVVKFDAVVDELGDRSHQFLETKFENTSDKKLPSDHAIIVRAFRTHVGALMRDEFSWAQIEGRLIAVVQHCYSQQDVNALVVFYRSAAGRAVLAKIPETGHVSAEKTLPAWSEMEITKGEGEFQDEVAQKLGDAYVRRQVDELAAFYESNIGRNVVATLPSAQAEYENEFQKLNSDLRVRYKKLLLGYRAQMMWRRNGYGE